MAEPKENEFLDDIDDAEAEAYADEMSEIDDEALELDELRAERDQLKDRFMRALADAENARKRSDKDRREAEQYGGSKLARDMLPVYDNMKRALDDGSHQEFLETIGKANAAAQEAPLARNQEKKSVTGVGGDSNACGSCGTGNPSGFQFCGGCGQKLSFSCAGCGTPAQPGFKFCGNCGHTL